MTIYAPRDPAARARRARSRRVLAVVVVLAGAAVVGPQAFASDAPTAPVAVDTYTVSSGETLWSIASAMTPAGDDVRDTMSRIRHLNALEGVDLAAGQQLFLPVAG